MYDVRALRSLHPLATMCHPTILRHVPSMGSTLLAVSQVYSLSFTCQNLSLFLRMKIQILILHVLEPYQRLTNNMRVLRFGILYEVICGRNSRNAFSDT